MNKLKVLGMLVMNVLFAVLIALADIPEQHEPVYALIILAMIGVNACFFGSE